MQKPLSKSVEMENLEDYFAPFRNNIVGNNKSFTDAYGTKKVIYADWIASGRLYEPMEKALVEKLGPFISNPHSYSSYTGQQVTHAYAEARNIIRKHVNANADDCLVTTGSGMTGALMRFQEMIGLKTEKGVEGPEKPVVFITHMEHHSNQTSWLETIAKVVVIPSNNEGLPCLDSLKSLLLEYSQISIKIAAITGCSNVTGIRTNYHEVSKIMHQNNGLCFVDFACSAPYVSIDMHPADEYSYLDAIIFSPFLSI